MTAVVVQDIYSYRNVPFEASLRLSPRHFFEKKDLDA
jgi:hypothetical protein